MKEVLSDWLHAAAHGNYVVELPDPGSGSALWLEQDRPLSADELVGPKIQSHFRRSRPVFFLNACQLGRQGWALTRIDGWANRLVSLRGAKVCLSGPFWEVDDHKRIGFLKSRFYGALFDGKTVAEARVHDAREAPQKTPGDPTWAAYSVYAHPNARLKKQRDTPPDSPR